MPYTYNNVYHTIYTTMYLYTCICDTVTINYKNKYGYEKYQFITLITSEKGKRMRSGRIHRGPNCTDFIYRFIRQNVNIPKSHLVGILYGYIMLVFIFIYMFQIFYNF